MKKEETDSGRHKEDVDGAGAERVLLVGLEEDGRDFERAMDELAELARACFMEPVGIMTQRLENPGKEFYIGRGKVQEVKETAGILEADLVLFYNDLTPSQLRNLQDEIGRPVMDRTALILDIFESRARTREARLQVEAARLRYLLPRLVGMHKALTRQGGTSGSQSSRGAGEKKLELDRRRIEHRISELTRELEQVSREREVQRKKRQNSRLPLVTLVGYTNAGKSTIMNGLLELFGKDADKKVLEQDMLFATLDTSVRRICAGQNRDFLLSDTVGFIHKLPHGLIKAFRSTLEEVCCADLLLHVVDYSDPFYKEEIQTTRQTLEELEAGHIPILTVFNKTDKCEEVPEYPKAVGDKLYLSATQEDSLILLTKAILEKVYSNYVETEFLVPYDKGAVTAWLLSHVQVLEQEYRECGTWLRVNCSKADRDKYMQYILS